MAACFLCCEKFSSKTAKHIEVFSEEGLTLNVCAVIVKHFWLRPKNGRKSPSLCTPCWNTLHDFDELYQRVALAHNYIETKDAVLSESDALTANLPHLLKAEELTNSNNTTDALDDALFDPEVKLEVNELDLLPQIEIIERTEDLSKTKDISSRAQRASTRRSRQVIENTTNKRIKREYLSTSGEDSEPELPLSLLMHTNSKTESNTDFLSEANVPEAPPKKRRGRPPKKRVDPAFKENDVKAENPVIVKETIKVESENEDIDREFLSPPAHNSGTEDSASSSSSSDSGDSDSDTWPAAEPEQRFAEIPKRVIVKPKKYTKRPKPLIPPKRMTREELERKREQQEEFDKIIARFFDTIECPKCDLLVQNFADMKRHFVVSHNDNSGYISCCGRKFQLRKALAEHILVHWNPDHFKCKVCEKILQDSRTLEIHEATHSEMPGELKEKKMFSCDQCTKQFSTKATLEHHLFSKHVPKSEFKFSCPECNKKLPTSRKLKDHLKYSHDPESAVICDKCGKKMRNQSTLKKHTQLEHSDVPRPTPEPMQCEICGTWLRHLAGLKQHMKSIHEDSAGEHRCHICNKTSTNARALKRHIYHNHECERKHKCTMCEKAFKRRQDLREHTSVHTGEVLYTCPNCPMTFFSNANMYKHRQRLHRAEWEAGRKKPTPPNIMRQAVGATVAMKMQQAIGSSSAFFAQKITEQVPQELEVHSNQAVDIPQLEGGII